ncbi:unnamed protein product [Gongylonema pulchrum]|uniref:RING-type E3 ubiquitin transferase n=1 Tax=Gongylonema pulchrum TaxID=637853 RepID=A0A183EEW8_9BILA|nr:unnamed protein product [Gongylonema pulchrum]
MVSGRGDGAAATSRQPKCSSQLTSYDKYRKPHAVRGGIDAKSVHFEWISKELECGICEKTIHNTMVVRNCMHRFCADCILRRIHTGVRKCPTCHKVLPKKAPVKSDENFDAIIRKVAFLLRISLFLQFFSIGALGQVELNIATRFTKKRCCENKTPADCLTNSDPVPPPPLLERMTTKSSKSAKHDSASSSVSETKPPLLPSNYSDTSDPPLKIDEGTSSDDGCSNLLLPSAASPSSYVGNNSGTSTDTGKSKTKTKRQARNRSGAKPLVAVQKSSGDGGAFCLFLSFFALNHMCSP